MLFNLERLRREQDETAVFQYIQTNRDKLLLPDQDVISGLYEGNILPLGPFVYNMTEKTVCFAAFKSLAESGLGA